MGSRLGRLLALATKGIQQALQQIGWRIHIEPEEGMRPVVAFNPHEFALRGPVEVEWESGAEDGELVDDEGASVAFQISGSRLVFVADERSTEWNL